MSADQVRITDKRHGSRKREPQVVEFTEGEQPRMTGLTLLATYDDGDVHAVHFTPRDDAARIEVEIQPHREEDENPFSLSEADGYDIRIKGAGEAKFR